MASRHFRRLSPIQSRVVAFSSGDTPENVRLADELLPGPLCSIRGKKYFPKWPLEHIDTTIKPQGLQVGHLNRVDPHLVVLSQVD